MLGHRIFLAAVLVAGPAFADAHMSPALTVTETVAVEASADDVWARIGDFQDMSWHPAVFSTEGENGNDEGATRLLTLGEEGGPTVAETLTAADEHSYSYQIDEVDVAVLPFADYSATLSIEAAEDGHTVIHWEGSFNAGGEASDEDAMAAASGVYRGGLDAVKAELEGE